MITSVEQVFKDIRNAQFKLELALNRLEKTRLDGCLPNEHCGWENFSTSTIEIRNVINATRVAAFAFAARYELDLFALNDRSES